MVERGRMIEENALGRDFDKPVGNDAIRPLPFVVQVDRGAISPEQFQALARIPILVTQA